LNKNVPYLLFIKEVSVLPLLLDLLFQVPIVRKLHHNVKSIASFIEKSFFISNYIWVAIINKSKSLLYRCKNSDLIESIHLLLFAESFHSDLYILVNKQFLLWIKYNCPPKLGISHWTYLFKCVDFSVRLPFDFIDLAVRTLAYKKLFMTSINRSMLWDFKKFILLCRGLSPSKQLNSRLGMKIEIKVANGVDVNVWILNFGWKLPIVSKSSKSFIDIIN
jgi:hypothetical protein